MLVPALAGLLAERAPQVECRALEAPLRQAAVQIVQQLIHPGRNAPACARACPGSEERLRKLFENAREKRECFSRVSSFCEDCAQYWLSN